MFTPDDPLAPPRGVFAEPWQAIVLAMAAAMIREGHFSQGDWASALGAALKQAEADGAPDMDETYFQCVLEALEGLSEPVGISASDRETRKAAWADAYRRTPHGKPVLL